MESATAEGRARSRRADTSSWPAVELDRIERDGAEGYLSGGVLADQSWNDDRRVIGNTFGLDRHVLLLIS